MRNRSRTLKLLLLFIFVSFFIVTVLTNESALPRTSALSTGPPAGFTGAPGEGNCMACHGEKVGTGTFVINSPQTYTPGQTYQVTVQHQTADQTRRRWGFEMTALAGNDMAGTFGNLSPVTQIISGPFNRSYIEHTLLGTFANQANGAFWTVNWTAPTTNVGPVTFYAAGNQADNDGTAGGDHIFLATAVSNPPVATLPDAPFDFDGDDKTDIGIFRPGPGEWWINRSSDSQVLAAQFGAGSDKIVPGDFTGDGKADLAFWRPSTGFWFILRSEDFSFFAFPFGSTGDTPVSGDFDGDNKTDAAIYRPNGSTWFISRSSGGTDIVQFGSAGDQPEPGDYDGDGKTDIAIRRPNGASGAEWWISRSSSSVLAVQFGAADDLAVQGDYTGDGKIDVAFWRPSTGFWFVLRSEDFSFFAAPFGSTGDLPVSGDYDGDGKWDLAVFRPSETNWFINRSTAGTLIMQFGAPGDLPIPHAFVP